MNIKTSLQLPDDFDDKIDKHAQTIIKIAVNDKLNMADEHIAIQALVTEVRRLVHQAFKLGMSV